MVHTLRFDHTLTTQTACTRPRAKKRESREAKQGEKNDPMHACQGLRKKTKINVLSPRRKKKTAGGKGKAEEDITRKAEEREKMWERQKGKSRLFSPRESF